MRFKVYSVAVFLLMVVAACLGAGHAHWGQIAVLSCLAVAASASPLAVGEVNIVLLLPVLLPAMVHLTPGWACLIGALGSTQLIQLKWPVPFFLHARSMVGLPTLAGSLVYHRMAGGGFSLSLHPVLALVSAYACYEAVNMFMFIVGSSVKNGKIPSDVPAQLFTMLRNSSLTLTLAFASTALYTYEREVFCVLILIFVINKDKFRALLINEQLYPQIITAMMKVIENADSYTKGHSLRVAQYSVLIGKQMRMRSGELRSLRLIATLHDLGKQSVPGDVIRKSSRLTTEEFEMIRNHCNAGEEILKDISLFKEEDLRAIREHHEWFDGQGYPVGLKGHDICQWARIIAVADAFDAMTSERPYRDVWNVGEAASELARCAGSQFDPEIVRIFLVALESYDRSVYMSTVLLPSAV